MNKLLLQKTLMISFIFSTYLFLFQAQANAQTLQKIAQKSWAFIANNEKSSNSALFVGDQSALIVDPGLSPSVVSNLFEMVKKVTTKKIKWVVLTHWHPDHALGMLCHQYPGITLIAHPKTRRAMVENIPYMIDSLSNSMDLASDQAMIKHCGMNLPQKLIKTTEVIDLGHHKITISAVIQAHTSGDLIVFSKQDNVLVTGDLFLHNSAPSTAGGNLTNLAHVLDQLIAKKPKKIIPGHFNLSNIDDLKRFNRYIKAQLEHADKAVIASLSMKQAVENADFKEFDDLLEYPQYEATRKDNARAAYIQRINRTASPGQSNGYQVIKILKVGKAPHQISFTKDGKLAYIATAGSDKITVINTQTLSLQKNLAVAHVPLGVKPIASNQSLIVSQFRSNTLINIDAKSGQQLGEPLVTGGGASLFFGPIKNNQYLIPVEKTNKVWVIQGAPFRKIRAFDVGKRPFPVAATSDSRLVFVPGYDDGSVTVIDMLNEKIMTKVAVGDKPSGGVVLPNDVQYAVAVRGENKIKFINTASFTITAEISDGIGESPFSVVLGEMGKRAYINNTASHDISVIDLATHKVIARIPVGKIPIVMEVAPDGKTLWVACEGTDELYIIQIPEITKQAPVTRTTQKAKVGVFGMIHGAHKTSELWGIKQLSEAIQNFKPDVICTEIAPNRWPQIWRDWTELGQINDPRVKRFPEYTDVILPLRNKLPFIIEPCAAWNKEMSDYRQTRMKWFEHSEKTANLAANYKRNEKKIENMLKAHPINEEDPLVIHSKLFDKRTKQELQPYDHYLNDVLGPGGWTHINQSHYQLIDEVIKKYPGKRILITFGAGHKYWILEKLKKRNDIKLLNVAPFLENLH